MKPDSLHSIRGDAERPSADESQTPVTKLPVPRFAIGDTVYVADTVRTRARHECPDCNGTRKWSCKSPAGVEMEMDCPRCQRTAGWNDKLSLEFTKHATVVSALTVGSVQINTADNEHPVRYMCHETGIGSGSVYYEDNFHATEESANLEARAKALELQREEDDTPRAMQVAAYGRLGYFDAFQRSTREEIEQQVRDSMKSTLPPSDGDHTAGEWRAHGNSDSDDGVFRFDIDAVDPASGISLGICSGYGGLSSYFASRESGPANARLIAAAPNLLHEAQETLGMLTRILEGEEWGEIESYADGLRAAIAKATGVEA
jgi:hypothetical protein